MNLPPWDFSKRNSHFEKVQSEKYFHASVLEVARGLYDWCVNTVCMRNITVFHGVNSVLEVARRLYESELRVSASVLDIARKLINNMPMVLL